MAEATEAEVTVPADALPDWIRDLVRVSVETGQGIALRATVTRARTPMWSEFPARRMMEHRLIFTAITFTDAAYLPAGYRVMLQADKKAAPAGVPAEAARSDA